MKDKYPHLGKYYDVYYADKLAKARVRLVETMKNVFEEKFRNSFCVWRLDDGQLVMCHGRRWGSQISVAPIVMELTPDRERILRLMKIMKNYLPHFPVMINGVMMHVDLQKPILINIERLVEFVCIPSGQLPTVQTLRLVRTRGNLRRLLGHLRQTFS